MDCASDRYRMAKTAKRASGAQRVERGRNGAPKSTTNDKDIYLEEDPKTISIKSADLIAKLRQVEASAHGDIARTIELLLIENHVLKRQRSNGLTRGVGVRYDTYPRFLKLEEVSHGNPDDAEVEAHVADT